jgi:hypothetical protein
MLKIKRILLILSLLRGSHLNLSGAIKECSISYLFVEAYCLNIKDLALAERILLLSAAAALPRLTTLKFHSYEHQQSSRSFASTEL